MSDEIIPEVERAIALAVKAHWGQVDKAGVPYILHPLRVMAAVEAEDQAAAVLHDVVEDTSVTLAEIFDLGFSEATGKAVDAMTRRKEETYKEYIARLCGNDSARRIKRADIEDNRDPSRGDFASRASLETRYVWALMALDEYEAVHDLLPQASHD